MRKAGRPPINPDERMKVISFAISQTQMAGIKDLAKKQKKSLSKILRDYIDNILIIDNLD